MMVKRQKGDCVQVLPPMDIRPRFARHARGIAHGCTFSASASSLRSGGFVLTGATVRKEEVVRAHSAMCFSEAPTSPVDLESMYTYLRAVLVLGRWDISGCPLATLKRCSLNVATFADAEDAATGEHKRHGSEEDEKPWCARIVRWRGSDEGALRVVVGDEDSMSDGNTPHLMRLQGSGLRVLPPLWEGRAGTVAMVRMCHGLQVGVDHQE